MAATDGPAGAEPASGDSKTLLFATGEEAITDVWVVEGDPPTGVSGAVRLEVVSVADDDVGSSDSSKFSEIAFGCASSSC